MGRLTRFSKKWLNLKRAYAVQIVYYNFCGVYWTIEELITSGERLRVLGGR